MLQPLQADFPPLFRKLARLAFALFAALGTRDRLPRFAANPVDHRVHVSGRYPNPPPVDDFVSSLLEPLGDQAPGLAHEVRRSHYLIQLMLDGFFPEHPPNRRAPYGAVEDGAKELELEGPFAVFDEQALGLSPLATRLDLLGHR